MSKLNDNNMKKQFLKNMKTRYQKIHKLGLTFFLFIALLINLQAQVNNGSFETINATADLSGWTTFCGSSYVSSFQDAAPGGGMWCAQIMSGNTQGCYPAYVYQVIPDMKNGEIWRIDGWVRSSWLSIGISLGVVSSNTFTTLSASNTTLTTWTFLSVEDTIVLSPGDSAAIFLNPGMVGGPAAGGFSYFDLITARKTGNATGIFTPIESKSIPINGFPNPFNSSTTIKFDNKRNELHNLIIYNSYGQLVRTVNNINTEEAVIERKSLPIGLYFLQLSVDGEIRASGKLVVE